jgi:hypothetical protein
MSIPGLWGQFLHGLFFKMIYVTLIVSSNKPGDISSHPFLPGLFWCHFLPPNFLTRRVYYPNCHHTKVAIHSISLSLPLSPLRQQPYRVMIVPRARRVYYPNCHVLTNWNWATTQENLHCVFYKCAYFSVSILWYTCMFYFASRLSVRLCTVNLTF